MGREM